MAAQTTAAAALTDKVIASLPPGEYPDGGAPGLRLRVTDKGVRVFRWAVKDAGRLRWVTLGRWATKAHAHHITVNQARARLDKAKAAAKVGGLDDLLAEWNPPKPKPAGVAEGALTLNDLASPFKAYIARRRSRSEVVGDVLDRDLLPILGDRAVASITTPDIRRVVEGVVSRGAATHAGRVLQVTKQLLRFAQGRGDITANPADPLDAGALGVVHNVCDRVLNAEEIPAFWAALDNGMSPTVRNALRLLLLTGVRSGELLAATWDEVDLDAALWTLPAANRKLTIRGRREAKPFRVPLAPGAVAIFRDLRALADSIGSRYVLASFAMDRATGKRGEPITDKALNHAMRRLFEGKSPALRFQGERPTPHDLRRTLRSGLSALGVQPHIAETCLGHSLGRIAKTYDVHEYLDERRDALARWDAFVQHLLSGQGAEVVALPKAVRS